jgi:threonine/homoserine/homoserine lactone efflux protein
MDKAQSFESGVTAGMLLMLGSIAAHWFITPAAHSDAGPVHTAFAAAQLAAGWGGGGWLLWRARRRSRAGTAPDPQG